MGSFVVTDPSGKKYKVTAPEGATQDQVLKYAEQQFGSAQPTAEDGFWSTVRGLGKAGASGLAAGIEGVLGLPGDVERGVDWLADKTAGALGAKPAKKGAPEPSHVFATSGQVSNVVGGAAKAVAGEETGKVLSGKYEPKNLAESYLKTAAEFVPGSLTPGGEASLLRRLTLYGLVPAVASETAGQLTKGSPWETAARIATGLAAGAGTAAFDRAGAVAAASHDEIEARASALYDRVDQSGFQIRPRSLQDAAVALGRTLYHEGFDPELHPQLATAFRRMYQRADLSAQRNAPLTLSEVDRIRRLIKAPGGIFQNPDQQRLVAVAREHIDNWFNGLTANDVINARHPQQAVAQLQAARRLWRVNRKMDLINDIMSSAELRGFANYTQAGWQQAAKQLFRKLLDTPKKIAAFSPDEREAIRNIVARGPAEFITWLIGKMAIRGQVSLIGMLHVAGAAGGGFHAFGLPGLVAGGVAAAGGELSRAVSHGITHAKVRDMSELVRRGAGMGGRAPPRGRGFVNPAFYGGQATGGTGALVQWHGLMYEQTPDGQLHLLPGQSLRAYDTAKP